MKGCSKLTLGDVVTIDAMGCQKSIVEKRVGKQADYLFAVKANYKRLPSQIENALLPKITRQAELKQRLINALAYP